MIILIITLILLGLMYIVADKLLSKDSKKGLYVTIIICLLLLFISLIVNTIRFKYPTLEGDYNVVMTVLLIYTIPIIISVSYYYIKKNNAILRTIFMLIMTFSCFTACSAFYTLLFVNSPFYSETTNINNYLKVDKYVKNIDFMPEDLKNYEVIEYYYMYRHNYAEYRYDIYLEIKVDQEEYKKIHDDISSKEILVANLSKEYYLVGKNNRIRNSERDLSLIIFDNSNNTIVYQRSYDDSDLPYKMDRNIYDLLVETMDGYR